MDYGGQQHHPQHHQQPPHSQHPQQQHPAVQQHQQPAHQQPGYGYDIRHDAADPAVAASGGAGAMPQPRNWDTENTSVLPAGFRELCHKYLHEVIAYCSVFWSFGMCVAFLGPTLLDLGCQTSSDMKTISWVFFSQLTCSLIGSIVAGYLAQRLNANLVLTVSTSILPLVMFLIPFCKALTALGVVLAIMGINMGAIDCLANLQMIQVFGANVSPFLQALHFFYGLGAFVSPMIAEPFLLNEDCTPLIDNTTEPEAAVVNSNMTMQAETLAEAQHMTHVKYAFWILGALQLPIPFIMGSLLMRMKYRGMHKGHGQLVNSESTGSMSAAKQAQDYENIEAENKDKGYSWKMPGAKELKSLRQNDFFGTSTTQVIVITLCTAIICFMYDGLQSAYGGYVYSYAVKSIVDLSKTEGAYLNACFWGMFALGRLVSIPCATRFTPAFMLLCNITGCLLSMVLMLALQHNHIALYFGTCFFGLFMSSVTPTALSLAEQYIDVNSSITTIIVVIAATGEMIFPVVVGNIFVSMGPSSFLGFGNIACLVSFLVFGGLWFFGHQTPKYKATSGSFVWATMCCLRPKGSNNEESHVVTHHKYYGKDGQDSNISLELARVPQNEPYAPYD